MVIVDTASGVSALVIGLVVPSGDFEVKMSETTAEVSNVKGGTNGE